MGEEARLRMLRAAGGEPPPPPPRPVAVETLPPLDTSLGAARLRLRTKAAASQRRAAEGNVGGAARREHEQRAAGTRWRWTSEEGHECVPTLSRAE